MRISGIWLVTDDDPKQAKSIKFHFWMYEPSTQHLFSLNMFGIYQSPAPKLRAYGFYLLNEDTVTLTKSGLDRSYSEPCQKP